MNVGAVALILRGFGRGLLGIGMEHGVCLLVLVGLAVAVWRLRVQTRLQAGERARERRMREELEAYARLDASLGGEADGVEGSKALAKRVSRTVAEKSAFGRVAVLLRSVEGRLYCAGSVGVDDLTVKALHAWGEGATEAERGLGKKGSGRNAGKSFAIPLGEWAGFDREVGAWAMAGKRERRRWRRGIVAPIRTPGGRMAGAIAVCADGASTLWPQGLERAMGPIESLAARLATTLENEAMAERLLRAEKLVGLGQLAGGVAHALNNPLTAVLGFAELIAESSDEPRVRQDAETIRAEALKMRDTVQRLTDFWRPPTPVDEAVDVGEVLAELAAGCRETLAARGVGMEVATPDEMPPVRGSRARLRQVMEHLLNNAAQAIAGFGPRDEADGEHVIRVTVSHDQRALHVIVSDTGPGFGEPSRVFDPFYTTRTPDQGAGLGLSICYGIVREHGGEISALNLHPHGAAVVVELPVRKTVRSESGSRVVLPEKKGALRG